MQECAWRYKIPLVLAAVITFVCNSIITYFPLWMHLLDNSLQLCIYQITIKHAAPHSNLKIIVNFYKRKDSWQVILSLLWEPLIFWPSWWILLLTKYWPELLLNWLCGLKTTQRLLCCSKYLLYEVMQCIFGQVSLTKWDGKKDHFYLSKWDETEIKNLYYVGKSWNFAFNFIS